MKKTTKAFMAASAILFAIYGCNGKTTDQKSSELMRDSVPNDTTTIQYRDTNSRESRGDIPPTPQPDTSAKK
ncbi:hypothetical protein BWD42_03380 [Sphingobacterium sp. CZ-UAM]|uniref:hypothetical protein n=1 Tax=Sphingobacterium sp. CZ-UAM TaxID=1933868 RepID=UPI0009873AE1|nr:hypothetical protein [Sphingobacterium sp. CZ-UAM]OOG19008.1 hypothetical protein BWD42_03380 [Sphingobacterium sp. CZ-UAM]